MDDCSDIEVSCPYAQSALGDCSVTPCIDLDSDVEIISGKFFTVSRFLLEFRRSGNTPVYTLPHI